MESSHSFKDCRVMLEVALLSKEMYQFVKLIWLTLKVRERNNLLLG